MKLLGDANWYLPRWLEWLTGGPAEPQRRADLPEALPVSAV